MLHTKYGLGQAIGWARKNLKFELCITILGMAGQFLDNLQKKHANFGSMANP